MNAIAAHWTLDAFSYGVPKTPPSSVVERAEEFMRLPGSALGHRFDCNLTPWLREPIECSGDRAVRKVTLVKPVQAGGSLAGEVVLCDRLIHQSNGDIQYNWQNDSKAKERWKKRIEPILLSVADIVAKAPSDKSKWQTCLINFANLNLTVQGVFTDSNVASDSIRTQINEELHDREGGWSPGKLQQAYGRLTAYWDSFAFNISNAGYVGDQLHEALTAGTFQRWEVQCPGCRQYHVMRTRWDPKRPDLGGLRYDSEGAKDDKGHYNYNKLARTVFYQMPCGYRVNDDRREREELSASGRYSGPTNPNAHLSERSYTLEAVSVHYVPFLTLIREKHEALKSMKYGNADKWSAYVRERECTFWDVNDRPLTSAIVLNPNIKKDRAGLANRIARYFSLDRQRGGPGDLPHWWLLIRDAAEDSASQLVFEGRVDTDENVIDILDRHGCTRHHGVADSGDDTTHVYQFCLQHGINAIKGSGDAYFSHGREGRKIFSPEKPLWPMLNLPGPTKENPLEEPWFSLYSRVGTMDRLAWIRSRQHPKWDVPSDVSEDYSRHLNSWELRDKATAEGTVKVWVQVTTQDHLLKCETYICLLMEMAGLIGT